MVKHLCPFSFQAEIKNIVWQNFCLYVTSCWHMQWAHSTGISSGKNNEGKRKEKKKKKKNRKWGINVTNFESEGIENWKTPIVRMQVTSIAVDLLYSTWTLIVCIERFWVSEEIRLICFEDLNNNMDEWPKIYSHFELPLTKFGIYSSVNLTICEQKWFWSVFIESDLHQLKKWCIADNSSYPITFVRLFLWKSYKLQQISFIPRINWVEFFYFKKNLIF